MKHRSFLERRRVDAEVASKVFGINEPEPPHYSTEPEPAHRVITRMIDAQIEVIIGCTPAGFAIELRQWRDRRHEGIPGDPQTGRSRVTFVCLSGISFEEVVTDAVLRPETLEILNATMPTV